VPEAHYLPELRERIQRSADYPRWVLIACLSGMFATTFTITILGVSLAVIADDLGSNVETVAWVLTGPMLVQALALPVLGKLGDVYGHRRIYLAGFALAGVAALATAFAWDAPSLIGIRTVGQLVGTATMPSSTALLFSVYRPRDRVRAMGWVSLVAAGAPVLGLAIGGPMVDTLGWRPLFVIQAVLSVGALALSALVLRETARKQQQSLDLPGAATLAVAASAFTFGINRLPIWGISHPGVLGPLALVPIALFLFARVERRARHPLVPLEFFRRRNFVAPMISGFFMQFAYMGGFIITPLLLFQVFFYSATATSLLTMLRPLTFSLTSPIGGAIATRVGERRMAIVGTGLIAIAMLSFAHGASELSIPFVAGGLAIAGLGLGICQPSLSAIVGNAVDEHNFGIASSAIQMTSSVGAVAGVSVMTALAARSHSGQIFYEGYLLGAGIAGLGFIATLFIQHRSYALSDTDPPT
jgi:EmrB/QacA subfamily drug resistance transporter